MSIQMYGARTGTTLTRGVSGAFLILWTGVVAISHSSFSRSLLLLPAQHQRREAFLVPRSGVLVISKSTFEFLPQSASRFSPNTRDARHFWCFLWTRVLVELFDEAYLHEALVSSSPLCVRHVCSTAPSRSCCVLALRA